jgi:hypothetical protein
MNLSTRIAVWATVVLVGLGIRFFIGHSGFGSGEAKRAARDVDAICAEALAAPNHQEAREWCQDSGNAGFEMSRGDMLALAEAFYSAGAEKVFVTDIERVGNANVSASMVVVLPSDGSARKSVFEAESKFAKKIGEEPVRDVGQKYVHLALD